MINPENADHRDRFVKSVNYWHVSHDAYRSKRRQAILNYVGSSEFASKTGVKVGKPVWANLVQMSALARSITLAFNEPRYVCVANNPVADAVAPRLQEFLNRWVCLTGLGDTARAIGLDSFFGYGVTHTGLSILPPAAQAITGAKVGPITRRVSQDHFLYDGSATRWDEVSYIGHMVDVPLDEAKAYEPFLEYNPDDTLKLTEHTLAHSSQGQIDSAGGELNRPQAMVRLVEMFFPHANTLATWAVDNASFGGMSRRPLWTRPYTGHYSGPYTVLSDMDIPDNLLPVAQAESTMAFYMLFNELADMVAHQAKEAKAHPIYETGSHRDWQNIDKARDRDAVAVSNIQKIGIFERPGPTQGVMAVMQASYQFFKELSGNLDDTLGLGPTAPTGKQSQLIREATTARAADMRRRMDRCMELIAQKQAHYVLNDETLSLPARTRIPGTDMTIDNSWSPDLPRSKNITDYDLKIVTGSMAYRAPEGRIEALNEATGQIVAIAQAAAQGVPLDLEKYTEIQANYRDLPELRDVCIGMLPEHQEKKSASEISTPDPTKGQYHRFNHSEKTNQGQMVQNMTQTASDPGGVSMAG